MSNQGIAQEITKHCIYCMMAMILAIFSKPEFPVAFSLYFSFEDNFFLLRQIIPFRVIQALWFRPE